VPDSPHQSFPTLSAFAQAVADRMNWSSSPVPTPVREALPEMLWNASATFSEALRPLSAADTVLLTTRAGVELVALHSPGRPGHSTLALLVPGGLSRAARTALKASAPAPITVPFTGEGVDQVRSVYGDFDDRMDQVRADLANEAARAELFADYRDLLIQLLPGTWTVQVLNLWDADERLRYTKRLWCSPLGAGRRIERAARAAELRSPEQSLVLVQDAGPGQSLSINPLMPAGLWVAPPQVPRPAAMALPPAPEPAAAQVAERMLPVLARARWITMVGRLDQAAVELRQTRDAWKMLNGAFAAQDGWLVDADPYGTVVAARDLRAWGAMDAFLTFGPRVISAIRAHAPFLDRQATGDLAFLGGLARHLRAGTAVANEDPGVEPHAATWPIVEAVAALAPRLVETARLVTDLIGTPPPPAASARAKSSRVASPALSPAQVAPPQGRARGPY
jgi:hypothetical protein